MKGKTINGFEIKQLLGTGGMAEVWYAESKIGMKAAVKILNEKLSHDDQMQERFLNEAKVMVQLDHPNIRKVYGFDEIDGRPAIVMEYLDGSDLKARMKQGQRFTQEELVKWWNQMVDALNYTHQKGIVHRDIKPSNIFVDAEGNAKLLDFGIAKVRDNVSATLTGQKLGTLMYMSPEQVRDPKRVGAASDAYSLAVTFVHLLTGKAPYDSDSSSDYDIQESIVRKPLDLSVVSSGWRVILATYLEKEPEKRPELRKIEVCKDDGDEETVSDSEAKQGKKTSKKKTSSKQCIHKILIAVVVVLAIVVIVGIMFHREKAPMSGMTWYYTDETIYNADGDYTTNYFVFTSNTNVIWLMGSGSIDSLDSIPCRMFPVGFGEYDSSTGDLSFCATDTLHQAISLYYGVEDAIVFNIDLKKKTAMLKTESKWLKPLFNEGNPFLLTKANFALIPCDALEGSRWRFQFGNKRAFVSFNSWNEAVIEDDEAEELHAYVCFDSLVAIKCGDNMEDENLVGYYNGSDEMMLLKGGITGWGSYEKAFRITRETDSMEYHVCQSVEDYRGYLVGFGTKALYYAEAKQFIDDFVMDSTRVADSITKVKQAIAEAEEDAAYKRCTTIEGCENYLKDYPEGRYVVEVTNKLAVLKKNEMPSKTQSSPTHQNSKGVFSVSANKRVYFASGNLQYQASSHRWRFAPNPWDCIGEDNKNVSSSYSGWIDLFGWGTGNDPTKTSSFDNDYPSFIDWGINLQGKWRTLSIDEWEYVFDKRNTVSGIRYAMAEVNGVNGIILVPDDWKSSIYNLGGANMNRAGFASNRITAATWNATFAPAGAVFLPAGGRRLNGGVSLVGKWGMYWSSSSGQRMVYIVEFSHGSLYTKNRTGSAWGYNVRLVRPAN